MLHSRLSLLAIAVSLSLTGHAIAQNDDCTGAVPVVNGPNGPYTNAGSSTSLPAWPCGAGANDVWFLYVAGAAGTLTADTCGAASYDSTLQIFDGSLGCGSLVSLGCNDDFCGLQSSVTTPVNPGVYYIRVGGFGGGTGTFTLNVNGPIGSGTVATNSALGAGCLAEYASFYENFGTSAGFDLANTTITMLPNGTGGYIALPIGAFLPVGSTSTPTTLALGDDQIVQVPFTVGSFPGATALDICSNGHVALAAGNSATFTPNVATMLSAPATAFWSWHDFNPAIAGGGQVKFEESAAVTVITWDGVWDFGGTSAANANTLQFQLHANGQVVISWGVMSGLGNGHLVGYSPGGPNANPGNTDISVAIAGSIAVGTNDILPLALAGSTRPIIGTNWSLAVSNVPATGVIGVDVFGFADPGINDLSFLGMPSCGLRASLDVVNAWFVAGPTHSYSLPIPNLPSLVNFHVFTTSAVFQNPPVNAFGAITSNGVDGKVGNI